jgi:hypothetical protein
MPLDDERMRILTMIQDGQISAEEGAKLLAALQAGTKDSARADGTQARWFRVRVTDLRTGKNKVNVNIPVALVHVGMRMGARFVPEGRTVDLTKLTEAIRDGAQGKLLDVEDEQSAERVEVFVE